MIMFKPFDFRSSAPTLPDKEINPLSLVRKSGMQSSHLPKEPLDSVSFSPQMVGDWKGYDLVGSQTPDSGKGFRGFGSISPTQQIGNEFLYSDEFTEKPVPKLSRPNTPSSTKITLLWQVREDAGPLRSTSGKSHL